MWYISQVQLLASVPAVVLVVCGSRLSYALFHMARTRGLRSMRQVCTVYYPNPNPNPNPNPMATLYSLRPYSLHTMAGSTYYGYTHQVHVEMSEVLRRLERCLLNAGPPGSHGSHGHGHGHGSFASLGPQAAVARSGDGEGEAEDESEGGGEGEGEEEEG